MLYFYTVSDTAPNDNLPSFLMQPSSDANSSSNTFNFFNSMNGDPEEESGHTFGNIEHVLAEIYANIIS